MTLALAISLNAILMLALVGALAFAMSRASRLKPHLSATAIPAKEPVQVRRPLRARRVRHAGAALADARP
jgi:hypothetical protein